MLHNYLEAIRDPDEYLRLDDTILHEVRMSEEPELAKARDLLSRFDNRKQYSYVGEISLTPE